MKKYLPMLRNSPFFKGLTDDEILSILHCVNATVISKEKDSYIFRAADSTEVMGLVASGCVLVVQEDLWGHRNILSKCHVGDFFGEPYAASPGAVLNVSVVADMDCEIIFLNIQRLLATCPTACGHHQKLIRNLVSVLANKILLLNDKITHVGKRTTREKLLSYLSAESIRHSSLSFDIPFDRQQLADYLCVDRAAMSTEISKLQKEEKPFHYEWVEGWSALLGSMVADLGVVMALFLGIVLSSLFAGEWHDNTSTLVLTTRNGWGKIALAKILTGLAFTVELFALLAVSNVISQLFFMGTAGWDMPIQNIKLIAVAPMNMLQAEIYEYAFVLLGAIGFAGIVMFISAAVKNNVLTLLLSLVVVYGPMMIAEYLPYEMQKALDLIPLVGSSTDIFRTNTFRIFGKLIWSPYLLITIPVLIGILCMPFAIKSWSRRMKA